MVKGDDVLSLLIGLRIVYSVHEGEVQTQANGDDGTRAADYEGEIVESEGPKE